MNPRRMVARTVILVLNERESIRGTVDPDSTAKCFVLTGVHFLEEGAGEAPVTGTVHVDAARPSWVQVV